MSAPPEAVDSAAKFQEFVFAVKRREIARIFPSWALRAFLGQSFAVCGKTLSGGGKNGRQGGECIVNTGSDYEDNFLLPQGGKTCEYSMYLSV
jgi:hypothetical protein